VDEGRTIARVLEGDPEAEELLYEAHVDRVFRLAHRMTGDNAVAQDLTQDVFVRAFSRLPDFGGRARFSTWLHSVAMSVILNALRKGRSSRKREEDWSSGESPARDPDLLRRIHDAIDRLPDDLRLVFVMHEIEGFKLTEIAEAEGSPQGTVRSKLSRAKEKLRDDLREYVNGNRHEVEVS
jgi:RNA polymerase sigma-70 factor (ECF subfamily)